MFSCILFLTLNGGENTVVLNVKKIIDTKYYNENVTKVIYNNVDNYYYVQGSWYETASKIYLKQQTCEK